jgi:hypothetical protein
MASLAATGTHGDMPRAEVLAQGVFHLAGDPGFADLRPRALKRR